MADAPANIAASSTPDASPPTNSGRGEVAAPVPTVQPGVSSPAHEVVLRAQVYSESSSATDQSPPNWLQMLGAFGVGAIVTKLLDILWLARVTREAEHKKWLREQRLAAYSDVARNFLSLRLDGKQDHDNPFQAYAVASRAMLLTHTDELSTRIDQFIVHMDRFYVINKDVTKQSEADQAYKALWDEARALVTALRRALTDKA